MSEELSSLCRAASSLALMMKGFDKELDLRLDELRAVLKEKDFHIANFNMTLQKVEDVYDSLEGISAKSIDTYTRTFEVLFNGKLLEILAPLKTGQPVISDLLRLAEPLASHINVLSKTENADNDERLTALRLRLAKRFKALLQTLMMMGNSSDYTLHEISGMLEGTPSWETLDQLATKTIILLQARLNEEKQQFEGYLEELTAKLNRINEIVETDSDTLLALKKLNVEFNSSINEQMRDARARIDDHHKVDLLKTDLLQSLDNIAARLETYQRDYNKSLQSLQSSKIEMTRHISELEKENLGLLSELQKERKLSMIDVLTQLPNRQGFNNRLEEELSRVSRYGQDLSIAILDIDFFKRINDDFGHLVGDKVLRMIASEMRKVSRETDFLARYGGEEFVLLMPQTTLADAATAAEKIRAHVEVCPFHYQNKPVKITVSIGVAQRLVDESTDSWIERADQALYKSKNNGRNKVTVDSENN